MTLTQAYILLAVAIAGEIISTGTLKATDGFTKWIPSLICILAIAICMYTMSHAMKILPIGITYATWSGVFGKSGCLLAVSPEPVTAQDTKTLLFIIYNSLIV